MESNWTNAALEWGGWDQIPVGSTWLTNPDLFWFITKPFDGHIWQKRRIGTIYGPVEGPMVNAPTRAVALAELEFRCGPRFPP